MWQKCSTQSQAPLKKKVRCKERYKKKKKGPLWGRDGSRKLLHNVHMVRELNKSHYPKHDSLERWTFHMNRSLVWNYFDIAGLKYDKRFTCKCRFLIQFFHMVCCIFSITGLIFENKLIFFQTLYWQKREFPPVGFEPDASHLPDERPNR